MARAVAAGQVTPADELRALLADSEKQLANVRGNGEAALRLLENMDRIAELWPELESAGVDLRPEAGRWETVQALTHKHAGTIAGALRGLGGLPALRGRQGGDLPWWWWLDREESERNRARARRFAIAGAIVVVALAGGFLLLRQLFPVDPRVAAASSHITAGQQKVTQSGDYQAAALEFQAAAEALPDDPEPWIWLGAAQAKLGRASLAQEAFARARPLAGSDLNFYLLRGPIYTELGLFDAALADLTAALQIDPENPQAYFFRANIAEEQGRVQDALADLDLAGQYAEARQQPQLVALARTRMGFLMQRLQAMPPITATPAPQ